MPWAASPVVPVTARRNRRSAPQTAPVIRNSFGRCGTWCRLFGGSTSVMRSSGRGRRVMKFRRRSGKHSVSAVVNLRSASIRRTSVFMRFARRIQLRRQASTDRVGSTGPCHPGIRVGAGVPGAASDVCCVTNGAATESRVLPVVPLGDPATLATVRSILATGPGDADALRKRGAFAAFEVARITGEKGKLSIAPTVGIW